MRERIEDLLAAGVEEGKFWSATWQVDGRVPLAQGVTGDAYPEIFFDLASLTKPLATALLALLLDQEGVLDLEAPARAILPELTGSAYHEATLLDLGCHRAGLPAWRPLYLSGDDLASFLGAIAAEPAGPKGVPLYSDLGYILLGAAVERAGGTTLDVLFQRSVAGPLGLGLGFAREGEPFPNAAQTEQGNAHERALAGEQGRSYAWRTLFPSGVVHDENARALGGVAGHAGLFGSAEDVATLAHEMLAPRILPLAARQRDLLLRPEGGPSARSFGMMSAGDSETLRDVLPPHVMGHFGFTGTSLWIDPVAHRIYVLLTNRVHPGPPGDDIKPVRREFHRLAAKIPAR